MKNVEEVFFNCVVLLNPNILNSRFSKTGSVLSTSARCIAYDTKCSVTGAFP